MIVRIKKLFKIILELKQIKNDQKQTNYKMFE